jgi:hypothetical protein
MRVEGPIAAIAKQQRVLDAQACQECRALYAAARDSLWWCTLGQAEKTQTMGHEGKPLTFGSGFSLHPPLGASREGTPR